MVLGYRITEILQFWEQVYNTEHFLLKVFAHKSITESPVYTKLAKLAILASTRFKTPKKFPPVGLDLMQGVLKSFDANIVKFV